MPPSFHFCPHAPQPRLRWSRHDRAERFLAVLNGKMPDRVPVTLFIQDQGHFLNQVYPDVDSQDFETLQLKVIEIQRQFGVNVFVRMLFGLNDPLSIHMGGLNVSQQSDRWEVQTSESHRGTTTAWQSTIRTPDGVLTQEFSRSEIRPGTFVYACTQKPIKTPADLDIAIKHEPPMPEWFRKTRRIAWGGSRRRGRRRHRGLVVAPRTVQQCLATGYQIGSTRLF